MSSSSLKEEEPLILVLARFVLRLIGYVCVSYTLILWVCISLTTSLRYGQLPHQKKEKNDKLRRKANHTNGIVVHKEWIEVERKRNKSRPYLNEERKESISKITGSE
jgi:hypothetical protein